VLGPGVDVSEEMYMKRYRNNMSPPLFIEDSLMQGFFDVDSVQVYLTAVLDKSDSSHSFVTGFMDRNSNAHSCVTGNLHVLNEDLRYIDLIRVSPPGSEMWFVYLVPTWVETGTERGFTQFPVLAFGQATAEETTSNAHPR
jgi:hypothetical protein